MIMPEENVIKIRLSLKGRPIRSYSFNQDVITVGRDPGADIHLDNAGVSREHVRIERLPNGHYCVKDCGSANGAFLNEERVQGAMIYNCDVLRIGKFSLWVNLERDRRGDRPREERKVASDPSQETMMLSTDELERLMKVTREEAGMPAESQQAGARKRQLPPDPSDPNRDRVIRLVGIGAVLILATSLGAGFAWLFLR
jgi:pSer/pThr/pTyr-binding forkhead associated (FHA) protein